MERCAFVLPVSLVALALAASPLSASSDDGAPPPTPRDLLRGPAVPGIESQSLVSRDMTGQLMRVEGRPEEAALAKLVLEPEVREAAKRVVDERFEAIREHVVDQIDLLRDASDATRSGDRKRAEELQLELIRRFQGADVRSPLVAPLSKVLPPDAAAELTRMVDEYWAAWISAESGDGRGDEGRAGGDEAPDRGRVEARLRNQLVQAELAAVHRAYLLPLQQKLDRIYEVASVTDAQRAAIRNAVIQHVKQTRLRATAESRLALARAIMAELDEDQEAKILAAALTAA